MPRIEGKSFSVETKEKSVENDSSGLLKISFAGSCWAQLHRGWHSLTSAASPSSPGANPVPDALENGDHHHCHPLGDQEPPKLSISVKLRATAQPSLHPSDREGTTELPATDQLALLAQHTCLQVQRLELQRQFRVENRGVPVGRSLQLS